MQALDPVCKMTVNTDTAAAKGTYDGRTVYFCSVGCQKAFEKNARARAP